MAYLTSYEGSNDDFENQGTASTCAQSFQVDSNGDAGSVSIYGSRGNASSGTFKLEIKTGATDGTVIATTGTLNSTVLSAYDGSPAWNEVSLTSSIALTTGTTYYLVLTCLTGSSNDEVRWSVDTTSAGYANGASWTGTTIQSTRDKNFRITEVVVVSRKSLTLLGVS